MTRIRMIASLLILLLAGFVSAGQPLPSSLEQVLQREANGLKVDRRFEIVSTDSSSRWQSGVLEIEGDQIACENLKLHEEESEYLEKRAVMNSDADKHLKLANWCYRNNLKDQCRAHLQAMLLENPSDLRARRTLGHAWSQGRWFTAEDISQAKLAAEQEADAVANWMPKLSRLVKRLDSRSAETKSKAIVELNALEDPDVIFPLELLVPAAGSEVASLLTNRIGKFACRPACMSLCRLAINSEKRAVNNLATRLLSRYHRDHYVPDLLGMLVESQESQSQIVNLPNGDLALHHLIVREVQEHKELHKYTKTINRGTGNVVSVTGRGSLNHGALNGLRINLNASPNVSQTLPNVPASFLLNGRRFDGDILADDVAMKRGLDADKAIMEAQYATIRRDLERRNAQVMHVLATTQGVTPGKDAKAWWSWWTTENERYVRRKPTFSYRRNESETNPSFEIAALDTVYYTMSCLIAGTQIQTSRGLVPIEKIEIGDRVMSQDVESGELALKPVLQTTIRPPKATLSIKTAEETIQATPGHTWWISGKGWLRAKELEPGMLLHTARGTAEIQSVELDEEEVETFNLVVADFHTYFVGKQRVLSYDNTPVKATFRPVPGYGTLAFNP